MSVSAMYFLIIPASNRNPLQAVYTGVHVLHSMILKHRLEAGVSISFASRLDLNKLLYDAG